jgi:nucleoside-diphosphate-sugar epimerase
MILEDGGAGVWTVGRDDNEIHMLQLAREVCRMVGAPDSLIVEVDPPERQIVIKRLSVERLRNIGWQPKVELDEGIKRTVAVVRDYDERGFPPNEYIRTDV